MFLDSECNSFDNIHGILRLRLTVGLYLKHSCSPNNEF